jgi:putative transposase
METRIRKRIKVCLCVRTRLHRWAFRQLQDFVAYRATALGIATVFTDQACTSKACSQCGQIGSRMKHRFVCGCGRAHSESIAALNHARLGESALAPRADVPKREGMSFNKWVTSTLERAVSRDGA